MDKRSKITQRPQRSKTLKNEEASLIPSKSVKFNYEVQKFALAREEVPMKEIIRQLIAMFQGIPGSFFQLNSSNNAFHIKQVIFLSIFL